MRDTILAFALLAFSGVGLSGCCLPGGGGSGDDDEGLEDEAIVCNQQFLTIKGCGSPELGERYYEAIDAEPTLDEWRDARCFGPGESRVFYINQFDLGFGRDMHCTECGLTIACYVTNYGQPGTTMAKALEDRDEGKPNATVAMDYDPSRIENRVRFYVYDAKGDLAPGLELDNEGEKYAPHVCMACHGGDYDARDRDVVGSAFIEFVPSLLDFPRGFDLDETINIEAMRELVLRTDPPAPIARSVRGGSLDDVFTPPGWEGREALYGVVQRYCLGCHNAQRLRQFDTFQKFEAQREDINRAIFEFDFMPHAERTAALLRADTEALALLRGEAPQLCDPEQVERCYEGPEFTDEVGRCRPGLRLCRDEGLTGCEGQRLPASEACNGIDDDCNGLIDDLEGCADLPESCAGLPSLVLFDEVRGSTEGAEALAEGSCAPTEGPEEVFALRFDEGAEVCLSTSGSPIDTVLYIRTACDDPDSEVACNDDDDGTRARLTLQASADTTYFVFIEGFRVRAGDYVLSLSPGPCL